MSGAIKRLQGESFAEFSARQRAVQCAEKEHHAQMMRDHEAARKAHKMRTREVSDFDYSMNG